MGSSPLTISGLVANAVDLTHEAIKVLPAHVQVGNVNTIVPKYSGSGIKLAAILEVAQPEEGADYIGLHGTLDDFHASIPLNVIAESAVIMYSDSEGNPLEAKDGGPYRFLIPNSAACHTDEIDECANVKFLDHIEFTRGKGFDNRPEDDEAHEALHKSQE